MRYKVNNDPHGAGGDRRTRRENSPLCRTAVTGIDIYLTGRLTNNTLRDRGERDAVPSVRQRRAAWIAALAGLLVTGSVGIPVVLRSAGTAATAAATTGGVKIAYFDQWSIYQNAFYIKNLDTEGIAS